MMQQQQQQQATVVNVGGQPYVQPVDPVVFGGPSYVISKFNKQQSIGLGIALIAAAVLSFIFNIVDLAISYRRTDYYYFYNSYNYSTGSVGHGFWVGIMCIITGGFGLGAGLHKTKCQIVTFNVLCIIAACLTFGQLVAGIAGATLANDWLRGSHGYPCPEYYYTGSSCEHMRTLVAMEALLACLAIVEAVAAIWGSVICCKAYCCCGCYNCCCCQTIPDYRMQPATYNGGQMVMITTGQQSSAPSAMYPVQGYPQAVPVQTAYGYNQPTPMQAQPTGYYPQAAPPNIGQQPVAVPRHGYSNALTAGTTAAGYDQPYDNAQSARY